MKFLALMMMLIFAIAGVTILGFLTAFIILQAHKDEEFVKKHPYLFEDKNEDRNN